MKIPVRKQPEHLRDWDPIHYQIVEGEFTTGNEAKDATVKKIVDYMEKNDPDACILQITECLVGGELIVRAEGKEETQLFIYNTLRKQK